MFQKNLCLTFITFLFMLAIILKLAHNENKFNEWKL